MDVLEPDISFVYENYDGLGLIIVFNVKTLFGIIYLKIKKTPIQEILNISVPDKEMDCYGLATRNSRLRRKYGAITLIFGTYVF